MKIALFLLLAVLTLPAAQAAQINLGGADYVALLDTTGRSCGLQVTQWQTGPDDLRGVKALLGTLHMSWNGPGALTLQSMTVTFTGAQFTGGNQTVEINGAELGYLWENDAIAPTFKAGEERSTTPFCYFMVGGLSLTDKYNYFESTGTIAVTGSYAEDGAQKTITGELPFRFHLTPLRKP